MTFVGGPADGRIERLPLPEAVGKVTISGDLSEFATVLVR
ncbi:hypothetical protein F4556_000468 [Kitasatospora gansuensis]|uniref:Uncharacterized protein n=1 Tax=Kitasatospora gansuensis TaxID=258050 RepID=A0A7W7S7X4_9ACTN|nr:hypothetical protein [Kitasatospora gansuensis]